MNLKRVLVIEPHPDDFLLMCAGTAKKWINEGKEVYVVTFTNGGSIRPDSDKAKLERSLETADADKIIGTTSREILDYDTRIGLTPPRQLYGDLVTRIRKIKPDLVVTTHKDKRHPDHDWIAEHVEEMVFQAGENIKLDWGEPVKVPVIWLGENPRRYLQTPDILIDISTTLTHKLEALQTQETQIPVLGQEIFNEITSLARFRARETKMRYAEAFQSVCVYGD